MPSPRPRRPPPPRLRKRKRAAHRECAARSLHRGRRQSDYFLSSFLFASSFLASSSPPPWCASLSFTSFHSSPSFISTFSGTMTMRSGFCSPVTRTVFAIAAASGRELVASVHALPSTSTATGMPLLAHFSPQDLWFSPLALPPA